MSDIRDDHVSGWVAERILEAACHYYRCTLQATYVVRTHDGEVVGKFCTQHAKRIVERGRAPLRSEE